jgi:hypothetical protein
MNCPCCGAEIKVVEIDFDFTTHKFVGIVDATIQEWKEAYPAVDVIAQLKRMAQWLLSNPNKKKKNYRKFITNWLAVSQQRGGDTKSKPIDNRPTLPVVVAMPRKEMTEEERQTNMERARGLIKSIERGNT